TPICNGQRLQRPAKVVDHSTPAPLHPWGPSGRWRADVERRPEGAKGIKGAPNGRALRLPPRSSRAISKNGPKVPKLRPDSQALFSRAANALSRVEVTGTKRKTSLALSR